MPLPKHMLQPNNPYGTYNPFGNNNGMFNITYNYNDSNNGFSPFRQMYNQVKNIFEQFNVFDSDRNGQKGVIDASEANLAKGSVFFVEEGMTEHEFISKNAAILKAVYPSENYSSDDIRPKLSDAVSTVVKKMLENGEFDTKKDMIMEKAAYLDKETLELVKSKLSPEEQVYVQEKWERFNNPSSATQETPDAKAEEDAKVTEDAENAERQSIIDKAKENGVKLSEEEIKGLSNEDLNRLVEAKISKQKAEQAVQDDAKNKVPKFGLE